MPELVKIILNKLILFLCFIHVKFILHLVKVKVPKFRIIIHNLIFIRLHRLFINFLTIDSNIILTSLTTLSFHSFIHFIIILFTILHSFFLIIRLGIILSLIFFINSLLSLFLTILVLNVRLFLIYFLLWFLVSNIILFYLILYPLLQLWKRSSQMLIHEGQTLLLS